MPLNGRRLYLFDIDGTLIHSGGAGSRAMAAAFAALWGRDDGFAGIEFSGRTDRAILRDALCANQCSDRPFEEDLRRFKRAYFRRLAGSLRASPGFVLGGVTDFLVTLSGDRDATVGLATGNFRTSAAMKLRHYGIAGHFTLGGFGDAAEERADVVDQALRAAKRVAGRHATAFVIGDTVHDIASAKAHGAVAVGVATGTASAEDLSRAGADIVLSGLGEAPGHLLPRQRA